MALNTAMTKYIFESPDGGETVYRREFGEQNRELIKEPAEKLREAQRLYQWKNILRVAGNDKELQALVEQVEVYYRLKHGSV